MERKIFNFLANLFYYASWISLNGFIVNSGINHQVSVWAIALVLSIVNFLFVSAHIYLLRQTKGN